jgi:uncharacterized protein
MKHIVIIMGFLMCRADFTNAQPDNKASNETNSQTISKQLKSNKMENQALQTVNEFLTAVQKGDFAKLGVLLHPELEWDQPGDNRFSGVKKSAKEVFQMVGGMFEMAANTLALTEVKVLAVNGNSVACLLHWKAAHPLGNSLDVDNIDVYRVEGGKIVKATIYSADLQQENLFWNK